MAKVGQWTYWKVQKHLLGGCTSNTGLPSAIEFPGGNIF